MKRNSAILLISDLHLTPFNVPNSTIINSHLQEDGDFIDCFIDSVKKQLGDRKVLLHSLIIAGDIANSGKKQEYEKATEFLTKLSKELGISKEFIFVVPGNHDINWTDIDSYVEQEDFKGKVNSLHEVKFKKFKGFYDNFFEGLKAFTEASPIVEMKVDESNKIIILALNSNYYESNIKENHYGYIKHDDLKEFLKTQAKVDHHDYGKIAIFHHHPLTFLNETDSNWHKTLTVLNNFGFHAFLHGHVHNDYSNSIQDKELNYFFAVGSFAKKDLSIINSYKLIVNSETENEFDVITFHYVDKSTPNPYWQEQTEINSNKILKIKADPIKLDKLPSVTEKLEIEILNTEELGKDYSIEQYKTSDSLLLAEYKRIILEEIREKKLFKTGHFHWSDNFRSHGLIDIFTLINSIDTKKLVIDSFIELIHSKSITFDSMIGVGFEGNIIGSQLALYYPDCNYTYVPSSLEYYNEFEKKIKLEHTKIAIIEDVIYKADALEIFLKQHPEMTEKIEEIELIALFFCGSLKELDNIRKIPKVKFNFIFDEITIGSCNYENDINECPIVKNNLDTYYKFH